MIEKVISGGQTGVDRAALDVAIELGIPAGGWCPKGRKAEDGRINEHYPLIESISERYEVRTELNVRDSDGTLIIAPRRPLKGGTGRTVRLAREYGRPHLIVDLSEGEDAKRVLVWIDRHAVRVLNVAGPRESEAPGIHDRTSQFLRRVLLHHQEIDT